MTVLKITQLTWNVSVKSIILRHLLARKIVTLDLVSNILSVINSLLNTVLFCLCINRINRNLLSHKNLFNYIDKLGIIRLKS